MQSSKVHVMLACGVGLLVLTSFYLAWQIEDERRAVSAQSQLAVVVPIDAKSDFHIPKTATKVDQTQLASADNDQLSGLAKHWEEGGIFKFRTLATLPAPARGYYYEAWLVGDTTISAGKLNPDRPGVWVGDYHSSESLYNYTKVLITQESAANGADGLPEKTMLEGDF